MRAAADTLKKITLELGGKSPNIVLADADMEAAHPRRDHRDLLRQGGGLRGGLAAAGRQVHQERVHRQARGAHEEDGRRRSDGSQDALRRALVEEAARDGAALRGVGKEGRGDARRRRRTRRHRHRQGILRSADGLRRRHAGDDHLARGDLRAGARGDRVRRPGRSDRARQRHRRTASPPASGRATSRRRTTSRGSSRPAPSGSTPTTSTTPPRRSAATSRAASAAR